MEKDKYATAATWFQYAKDKYPVAKIYCDISECLNNIEKFKKAEQFANLAEEYQALWEKITGLQNDALTYEDDLKLRVWNEIVNMIQNNATELCEVSSKENILAMLDNINTSSSEVSNAFLKNSISELKANIDVTKTKIQSVNASTSEGGEQ